MAELGTMLQQGDLRLVDVRARHGEAEPSGAGVPATHLLPQSAGYTGNVSEVRTDAEVYNLQGGITAWAQAGLPVTS